MSAPVTTAAPGPGGDRAPGDVAPAPSPARRPVAGRRPPLPVWLAGALLGLLGAVWSVAVPQFRAPDEAAHVDLVMYLAEGHGYPRYDGRYFGREMDLDVQRHLVDSGRPWPEFDAGDAPPRSARPDVDDLGGTAPDRRARPTNPDRPDHPYLYNQMPQHPPLYYAVMAGVVGLERALLPGSELPSLDREVGLLRLANVALVIPLPILAWALVRRLGGSDGAGIVASLLPLCVPQLLHIAGSVNNDNLFLLLGGVLAVLLAGVARGGRSRRTDLGVGVVVGLALLTKAFAVMFLPWVVCAYAVGSWTTGRRREAAAGAARAVAAASVVGAWWWVANLVRTGQVAPTTETLTRTVDDRPPGFSAEPLTFLTTFATRLVSRTWAWVGYRSPKFELPSPAVVVLSVVAVVLAAVAFRAARGGRGPGDGPRRVDLAVALLPLALLVAFIARRAWGLYDTTGLFAFIQGRYLYAAVLGPVAAVALGAHRLLGRWAAVAALGTAAAVQARVLADVVRGSWSGPGRFGAVTGMVEWSPWPPALVAAVAAGTIAAVGLVAWAVVRSDRGPAPVRA